MKAEEQKQWIKEFQKDKEKLEESTAILDKVIKRLKEGEPLSEIEEAMSEELDKADTLIGEVYFG